MAGLNIHLNLGVGGDIAVAHAGVGLAGLAVHGRGFSGVIDVMGASRPLFGLPLLQRLFGGPEHTVRHHKRQPRCTGTAAAAAGSRVAQLQLNLLDGQSQRLTRHLQNCRVRALPAIRAGMAHNRPFNLGIAK